MSEVAPPLQVLIADDDDDDFYFFSVALNEISLPVSLSRARDGEELMAKLEAAQPDILLLDLIMPGKDGKECLREIRSRKKINELPVLVCTSLTDLPHINFCFNEGANRYLIKPNTIGELENLLREILSDWNALRYPKRSEFVANKRDS